MVIAYLEDGDPQSLEQFADVVFGVRQEFRQLDLFALHPLQM